MFHFKFLHGLLQLFPLSISIFLPTLFFCTHRQELPLVAVPLRQQNAARLQRISITIGAEVGG